MINDLAVVALIPSRGGSKGIPRKNLAVLAGATLLERAIKSAVDCQFVDAVLVSTDDDEMESVSLRHGVGVHRRRDSAAADDATATDVVRDVMDSDVLSVHGEHILLVYLQPTSPFRTSAHVTEALSSMASAGASRCVSVVASEHPPQKALVVGPDGLTSPLFDAESVTANRQTLRPTWRPNGAIYVFSVDDFRAEGSFPVTKSVPYEMGRLESIDVDSPFDLKLAQLLLEEGAE
jgi:CMP-N-acetylneuraminic acid synthetase